MEFSDFLNIFLFNTNCNVGTLIEALKQTGYFQSLAEPNLIAYNGQEASFLAGGEFPVPFVSGARPGHDRVQGVRRPSELQADDRRRPDPPEGAARSQLARLQQRHPLEGFRIPALTTRRAETEVELRDGQSFAIAGLIDNKAQTDTRGDSDSQPAADHRASVQEQGGAQGADGTAGAGDAAPGAPAQSGRGSAAADDAGPIPAGGDDIGEQLEGGGGPVDAPAAGIAAPRAQGTS